ncbi:hypothetical protein FLJC2902T_25970 [Flavobacterium limnosediminis JC2902]|uniref:Lipoprotein n=1 Tax=Flavobacterium limnosediminis JC2902 TaxID=1341181 RepID=V6SIU1_9FLAO|nr:hypothetical protein [Flavobacterium limnosediminis]ESU26623.1 hypothetical protein FLJC2902T_25970 [Flavobacterium limnosediminis JC2902]
MKKIILFLAILSVSFFSSCSKDDDSNNSTPTPEGFVSAKINGVQKNFTVIDVDVIEYPEYTDVEITAHLNNDPSNTFELNLTRDSGEIYFVQYSEIENYYQPSETFTITINENTTNKLKGTLTGTMNHSFNILEPITVTEGTFDINY